MIRKTQLLLLINACCSATAFAPATTSVNSQLNAERNSLFSAAAKTASATQLNVWSPFKKAEAEPIVIIEEPKEFSPGPFDVKNGAAAATWLALITWAFLFAPGTAGSDADNALLNTLITQPTPRPEQINELWFAVWNAFVVVPATIGALAAPNGKGQRLPAAPFLWGSAFFGFFSLGPYFATRTDRSNDEAGILRQEDLGWASKTIFENRIFGAIVAAIAISIPFSSDIVVSGFDWSAKFADYLALIESSRFVAVATVDIVIMSIVSSMLVSEDCKMRGEGWNDKSTSLFVATLLLPVLGPALYLAARPSLEE